MAELVDDLIEENKKLRVELTSKKKNKDLSDVSIPYIKEKKFLIGEGVHNSWYYSEKELRNARLESEYGLFFDHNDGTSTQVGMIENPHWQDEGDKGPGQYGDVVIVDLPVAQKLEYGFKWGISPTIDIDKVVLETGEQIANNPVVLSYSLVLTPAVRATMLNNQLGLNNRLDKQTKGDTMSEETNIQKLAEDSARKIVAEELARKKKKDDEEKIKEDEKSKEKAAKAKLDDEVKSQLAEKDKQLKAYEEKLSKIEAADTLKESEALLKKEISIGRVSEPEKNSRLDSLKELSKEQRESLNETYDWMITSLQLDADEHPQKYLDTEGLSEQDLSAFTDFVKKFIKAHKGATVADAAKAWKKEKMGNAVKKKYPYPPPKESITKQNSIDNSITARQTLNSQGSESEDIQELADNNFSASKGMLEFMRETQGGN